MIIAMLRAIEQGRSQELRKSHGDCAPDCPTLKLIRGLEAAYNMGVEAGLIDWLRGVSHEPSCGRDDTGDLVRWITFEGARLPTVRVDLVDEVCGRKIAITKDGQQVDAVTFLARSLTARTRGMFAGGQANLT